MATTRPNRLTRSVKALLIAALMLVAQLGSWGMAATATTPSVIPMAEIGGSGGSGIVLGVEQAPDPNLPPVHVGPDPRSPY